MKIYLVIKLSADKKIDSIICAERNYNIAIEKCESYNHYLSWDINMPFAKYYVKEMILN